MRLLECYDIADLIYIIISHTQSSFIPAAQRRPPCFCTILFPQICRHCTACSVHFSLSALPGIHCTCSVHFLLSALPGIHCTCSVRSLLSALPAIHCACSVHFLLSTLPAIHCACSVRSLLSALLGIHCTCSVPSLTRTPRTTNRCSSLALVQVDSVTIVSLVLTSTPVS